MFNIAIIGCGLVGGKRATALEHFPDCRLELAYDIDGERKKEFVKKYGCLPAQSHEEIFSNGKIDIVIVSTINKFLVPLSIEALRTDKHVLCEKPPGRNLEEAKDLYQVATKSKRKLKIGFNHRHHPGVRKAKDLVDAGEIGEIYYIRTRYGHGGRLGYEKEWRANIDLSGGGELIDQGIHVLDLLNWFIGDFSEVFSYSTTYFWKTDQGQDQDLVRTWEDNVFALLKTPNGKVAFLHASCTQWKNLFSFEIFGRDGYLVVEGLGGSYGQETLKIGKRKLVNGYKLLVDKEGKIPTSSNELITNQLITNNLRSKYAGGPPDEEVITFDGPDISWEEEWRDFLSAISTNRNPLGNVYDGLKAMELVDAIYRSAREERFIRLASL
jgi:predicted dehydrogenase